MARFVNVNGIEVEEIRSIHSNWRGYSKTFVFNGVQFTLRGDTEEAIEADLKRQLRALGAFEGTRSRGSGSSFQFKRTTPMSHRGRPRGPKQVQDQLRELFGNTYKAAAATAMGMSVRLTEQAGADLLAMMYNKRGPFNTYSGNLERAYMATVVQGRNIVKRVRIKGTPKGNPFYTATNAHRAVKLFFERHPIGKIRSNKYGRRSAKFNNSKYDRYYDRVRYRYKKRFENEAGYTGNSLLQGMSRSPYFGYDAATGADNRIQSGVLVENLAPYAGAVQAAGYPVIYGGIARSYKQRLHSQQKQLSATITKRMLKAAGLI